MKLAGTVTGGRPAPEWGPRGRLPRPALASPYHKRAAAAQGRPARPELSSSRSASPDTKPKAIHTYWCHVPGRCVQVSFAGDWVLPLVEGNGDGMKEDRPAVSVAVRGLCPFHVVAARNSDDSVDCGGINLHMHASDTGAADGSSGKMASRLPVLSISLVTEPMPLSALLCFTVLRRVSLYFYKDAIWIDGIPKQNGQPACKSPSPLPCRANLPRQSGLHCD
ncbi:hypothetical protein LPJ61_001580 [Coemansia biformis]|uniref:Uncharacterized protein n=1 Tax=Coemansia biformis TaxID=1286918 RepID=A0A9W8CX62_9FUNG|nr:hypothetical protein LPJ61_001580 [Coemansia biformis]